MSLCNTTKGLPANFTPRERKGKTLMCSGCSTRGNMRRAVLIQSTTAECLWDNPALFLLLLETQQQRAGIQTDEKENAEK